MPPSRQTHSSYLTAPLTAFQLRSTEFDPDNEAARTGGSKTSAVTLCAFDSISLKNEKKRSAARKAIRERIERARLDAAQSLFLISAPEMKTLYDIEQSEWDRFSHTSPMPVSSAKSVRLVDACYNSDVRQRSTADSPRPQQPLEENPIPLVCS